MKKPCISLVCFLLSIIMLCGLVGCAKDTQKVIDNGDLLGHLSDREQSSSQNSTADKNSNSNTNSNSSLPAIMGGGEIYNFSESGSIISNTGTNLNLYINWTASSNDARTMLVKFTVGIESYSIQVGARDNLGRLKINGETVSFSTNALTIADNRKKVKTDFYTFEKEYSFEKGQTLTFDVIASWVFNGTYGGTKLETLVAGDTVLIKTPR